MCRDARNVPAQCLNVPYLCHLCRLNVPRMCRGCAAVIRLDTAFARQAGTPLLFAVEILSEDNKVLFQSFKTYLFVYSARTRMGRAFAAVSTCT
jgi:hypothetical protein